MPPRKKMVPRTFDEHLANVVESKRAKRNLTVEDLASGSGIPYQTLRRRLGGAPFTVNELERIGHAVEVSTASLVDEALVDYGGIDKLIAEYGPGEPMSGGASTVPDGGPITPADNVTYLGHVKPPMNAAADDNPRIGPKE